MHGFALNVSTDLSYFQLMNPCGISGCVMTSLETEMAAPVAMNAVRERVVAHFGEVFDREMRTEVIAHVH
jgi:lipoyl(octanoyl) transferase